MIIKLNITRTSQARLAILDSKKIL